jgi:hypothetical protein
VNIRLNKDLRAAIALAVVNHGFAAKIEALDTEFRSIRNDLIRHQYTDKQIKAMQTLVSAFPNNFDGRIKVNCGGPTITLEPITRRAPFGERYSRQILTSDDLPLLGARGWNETQRLDLDGEHPLAVRALAYAELKAQIDTDRDTQSELVRGTLDTFYSVDDMRRGWPDVMPIALKVIEARVPGAAPKPKLPALPIAQLNAALGLPPSNDADELAKAA